MAKTAIHEVLLCVENDTVRGVCRDFGGGNDEETDFICEHLSRVVSENGLRSDIVDDYEDEVSIGEYTWSASEIVDVMDCLDEVAEHIISENLVEEYSDYDFCECSSSFHGICFVVALEVVGDDGKARYFWDSCIQDIEEEPEFVRSSNDNDFNAWISHDCTNNVWYVGESDPEPEPRPEPVPNTKRLTMWVIKFTEFGIPYTAGHEDFGLNVDAFENSVYGLSLVGNIVNITETSDSYTVTFAISN